MRQYTNNEKAAAKMLIRFYNMQAGTALRSGSEENPDSNINMALDTLSKLDGDIAFVKAHIRQYAITAAQEGHRQGSASQSQEEPHHRNRKALLLRDH